MIAVHVDLSHSFCISAVSEQGPAHEYVVKLLALFVERVSQRQLVVDCSVSEPLALCCFCSPSACLPMYLESIASVLSFAPTCALNSPPINVCVRLPCTESVCFRSSEYTCCTCSSPCPRVREVQSELILPNGDSCESRPSMLCFFDVLVPSLVDDYCCSVAMLCCCLLLRKCVLVASSIVLLVALSKVSFMVTKSPVSVIELA